MPQQRFDSKCCSHQIHVPPELPEILKLFAKAAIKTQPKDVLAWSAAYFRAISSGDATSSGGKDKNKMASGKESEISLTPSLLYILNKQLGPRKMVRLPLIKEKWLDLALPEDTFHYLVQLGSFTDEIQWLQFLSLACYAFTRDITQAMVMISEILTVEPDGSRHKIPFVLFQNIYKYIVMIDGKVTQDQVNAVSSYLEDMSKQQDGFVHLQNFLSPDCPKLHG